ncbi:hypothetical protein [Loigolactobacillus coryniformis]|uniref:hypothetical protein n=1 Tax=Loigolactobacillus coryniformis TaxID=1610 RepID=UPI00345D7036
MALLYAVTGIVVILLRGIITEKLSFYFFKRNGNTVILAKNTDVNDLKKTNAQEA